MMLKIRFININDALGAGTVSLVPLFFFSESDRREAARNAVDRESASRSYLYLDHILAPFLPRMLSYK